MGMNLRRKDIEAFHADGAVALRGVVNEEWRRVLAEAIEDDIANPAPFYHGYEPDNGRGRFHGNLRTWEFHDGFRRFCFESPLPKLAAGMLGSRRINLLYDQLFVKEPGTVNRTRWHNDQPYWPIDGYQVMSFWVALDPGDVYAFHALVLHGAGGNASGTVRRRGYTARYTGDDVTYSSRPGTNKGLRNSLLADGDPLDSDQYPVVLGG